MLHDGMTDVDEFLGKDTASSRTKLLPFLFVIKGAWTASGILFDPKTVKS